MNEWPKEEPSLWGRIATIDYGSVLVVFGKWIYRSLPMPQLANGHQTALQKISTKSLWTPISWTLVWRSQTILFPRVKSTVRKWYHIIKNISSRCGTTKPFQLATVWREDLWRTLN